MLEYEELKSLYLTSQVKVAMASKIDDGGSLGCRFVVEFDFIVISKCECESYCYISWKIFIPIWTLVNKLHFVFSFYFTFPIMLMNMKTKTTMTVRAIFNSHKLRLLGEIQFFIYKHHHIQHKADLVESNPSSMQSIWRIIDG